MNKLTSIRIKQNDGTYSDDIPIQVLAENVSWILGSSISLLDILGDVKYTTKGSIQHQLDTFSLDEVENARVGADDTQYQSLKARLDGEYEDLQDAIAAVAANLQTQTGARSNADTAIRSDLSSEITSRINGDNLLSGQIVSLSSDVSDLEDALDDEVAARQSAINSEVTARNNAINSAINSEVTARNNAISSAIATEVTNRNDAISAEASSRSSADTSLSNQIAALQSSVGSPLVAATKSAMTNTSRIYVYTGSESGMTNGNWYYYNGSAWVSGGVYNSTVVETDKTLSIVNKAADALATGDTIQDTKAYIDLHHGGFKLTADYIESGGWVYSNKSVNVRRLRSQSLYYLKKGTVICCTANVNPITVVLMNTNPSSSWNIENVSANSTKKITLSTNRWVGFVFEKPDNSSMSVSDYDSVIGIYENYGQVPGKNVWIYQYGADGNDWCFVRTPPDYDPNRGKPYSFVICNHGNGWVMDGTEQYANYTKRTMYVPTNDPDYIADPDQYNGTSDSSLWYSNPTIETLLNYGYIVCGAENYGDALYGNEQCRSACVGFYEHMIRTYNVPTFCHMIGVSNGALTALNAAYLLGGRVKSLVLQYPLTCLVNQYIYHPDHRSGIRAAYNITNSSITPEELAEVVITHDPLTTDVVSDTKVGTIPPIKMWYSQGDTAVPYQYNAVALATLLHDSGKIVETVEAQGGHGDYTHFNPQACLSWFNKYDPFMLDT